jgi:restriction system protein
VAVPDFQTLMLPVLRAASTRAGEGRMQEIAEQIAKQFSLTYEDIQELLPSGKQTTFLNRLHWSKTYLQKAGLIKSSRRGYFSVSELGNEVLAKNPKKIDMDFLNQFEEYRTWKALTHQSEPNVASVATVGGLDPEEAIAKNFESLGKELSIELIQKIHSFTPAFFERLIVDLLLAMGYGGGRAEMGRALGRSGDGGIDGVIREDELGLDVVYVQAKRYAPETGVPVREIRDFVGSLEGHRASKGVFVTTSYFPNSAKEFVSRVSKRVILIDGSELARLMIRHSVGVRIRDTYEIKKIDEDYFSE